MFYQNQNSFVHSILYLECLQVDHGVDIGRVAWCNGYHLCLPLWRSVVQIDFRGPKIAQMVHLNCQSGHGPDSPDRMQILSGSVPKTKREPPEELKVATLFVEMPTHYLVQLNLWKQIKLRTIPQK